MMRMKLLKKSFQILAAVILVLAFALTVTACKNDRTTWKVTFYSHKGSAVPTQYPEDGDTVDRPEDPTREGFVFEGWYVDTSYENLYDFDTPVTHDVDLHAKWDSIDNYHKVTFNSNNGSEVPTQYAKDGGKITRPEDPTREGFTFLGWYDASYSTAYDFDTPVTQDVTLYAKWQATSSSAETVTITLNYNYDSKTASVEIVKGATLPLANQQPKRADWNFAGWYKDSACTQLFNLTESISADVTLYAKWSKDPVQPADGTGIDFSKEWDGTTTGGAAGSDNFVFDKSIAIGSVSGEVTPPAPSASEGEHVVITFNSNGGSAVSSQAVLVNGKAVLPEAPDKDGNMFCGWYKDSALTEAYDFNTPVTSALTLNAKWSAVDSKIKSVKGYNESLAVVFSESNPAGATVQYSVKGANDWKSVDAQLIRKDESGTARVDIVGLAAGEYDVKITPSSGSAITLPEAVKVSKHDRSGYAHFNRKTTDAAYDGVGAYKDDGTLKDNALVIYVTDANKDTVMNEVCAANSDVPMFQIPGPDWSNKNASGIGWWLNNNQYTSSNAGSKKNKVPSNTYDAANGGKLAFKAVNRPIVIRFIGTVTTPEGLTAYNDTKEGGGVGDNGHMARLKNLKNVTLEGIGDDATIKGWGFHYVIGTDAVNGQGTSFEVRNLTFTEYPEDAIGMEGQQANGKITAGVERCWVHNNVFLPGRCDNPAESDKKEGDGSCDFKRGQYYTLSYNYFEYCHKTNLIGSSDDSLQYNITMHHNMWYQCGSRIPLLRQANVHFYNNYILGDASEKTTPYSHISKPSLSYVSSLRANCLMFSEANYYDGCKNVAQQKSGMAVAWNNVYSSHTGDFDITQLTSRTQSVSSSCKYDGTDYTGFYANENLFYYDKENQVSDCEILDDAIAARARVLQCVGVNDFQTRTKMEMNSSEPKTVKAGDTVSIGKGKGQLYTFKLTAPMEVQVKGGTGSGDSLPQLLDCYGKVWLERFTGDKTVVLPAGVYFFAAGLKDKESTIASVTFADTGASSEARVNAAKAALGAIPDQINTNSQSLIKAARDAYNALMSDEKAQVDSELVTRLQKAEVAYESLAVERVTARIDYIGTVDKDSYNRINAARKEYTALSAEKQAEVKNYAKLTAAETEFAKFAVQNVNDKIADLPDLSKATISTQETLDRVENWFKAVANAYDELDEDQKDDVVGYSKVTAGLAELEKFENMINFRALLSETEVDNVTLGAGTALKNMYANLTDAQKAMLTFAESKKYEDIAAKHTDMVNQAVDCTFIDGKPSSNLFVSTGGKQSAKKSKFTVHAYSEDEQLASGLKFESSTEITVTVESKMTLTLYLYNDCAMSIDGTSYNVETLASGDKVVTVTLEKGSHTITRAKSENSLFYATLTPAA